MQKSIFPAAALAVSLMLTGCGGESGADKKAAEKKEEKKIELNIAAAASMTDALKEIAGLYQKEQPNVTLNFNFAASGKLQTQIEQGAPTDVFLSAAQKQMNALEEKNLIVKETRKDLLVNKVVLITGKEGKIADFAELGTEKATRIAIGDPASVPVGQYSEEVFKNLGLTDAVKPKLVLATDVRQVLAWVETGEAECGLVYATDAAVSDKVKIAATAPDGAHKPVVYPMAVVTASKEQDAAKAFAEYLQKEDAKKVFQKYGFEVK